jgi:hypothetical protein
MKAFYVFCLFFIQGCYSSTLQAQTEWALSIGAAGGIPSGQLSGTNQPGIGAAIGLRAGITDHISLGTEASIMNFTGRALYGIKYASRNIVACTAGGKFYLNPQSSSIIWYMQLHGGIHFDQGHNGPVWQSNAGCVLYPSSTKLNISVGYQRNTRNDEAPHSSFWALRVAYTLPWANL